MNRFLAIAFLALVAVFTVAAPALAVKDPVEIKYVPVAPEDLNALRFPENGWSDEMIAFITRGTKYLDKDMDVGVKPPPANDSAETKAEIELLLKYQREERTQEDIYQRILYENRTDLWDVFEHEAMFPVAASPAGRQLVKDALYEASYYNKVEKWRYQRPRPIQLSPDLTLAIAGPPHSAYPSGHSCQSYIIALVLGVFQPERAEEFKQFAREIGQRREIAGVHYPSDGVAGRHIAEVIFAKLMENPEFTAQVEAVKAELAS